MGVLCYNDPMNPTVPGLGLLFSGFPLSSTIPPLALAALFGIAMLYTAGMSVMLIYHWRKYPFERRTLLRAERLYVSGCFLFTVLAFVILASL